MWTFRPIGLYLIQTFIIIIMIIPFLLINYQRGTDISGIRNYQFISIKI